VLQAKQPPGGCGPHKTAGGSSRDIIPQGAIWKKKELEPKGGSGMKASFIKWERRTGEGKRKSGPYSQTDWGDSRKLFEQARKKTSRGKTRNEKKANYQVKKEKKKKERTTSLRRKKKRGVKKRRGVGCKPLGRGPDKRGEKSFQKIRSGGKEEKRSLGGEKNGGRCSSPPQGKVLWVTS